MSNAVGAPLKAGTKTSAGRRCFFRPSPSRLSPGRNTVFVPVERIVQSLASFPYRGIKREYGPVRSPSSPNAMRSPENKNQRKTNREHNKLKQNKPQKTKQEKPHYRNGQDSSMRIPATYVLTIEPCIEIKQRTETSQLQGAREGCKKKLNTLRKPGVPPARTSAGRRWLALWPSGWWGEKTRFFLRSPARSAHDVMRSGTAWWR